MASVPLEETKMLIKCLVVSSANTYNLETLNFDFKGSVGYEIPFRRYGYNSLVDFLKSMPDILQINRFGDGRFYIVSTSNNSRSKHITDMVLQQKKKSNRNTNRVMRRHTHNSYYQSCNPLENLSQGYVFEGNNIDNHNNEQYKHQEESQPKKEHPESSKLLQNSKDEEITKFSNENTIEKFNNLKIFEAESKFCSICLKTQNTNNEGSEEHMLLSRSSSFDECEWNYNVHDNFQFNAENISLNIQDSDFPDNVTSKKLHRIVITHIHNPHRFWFRFKSYDSLFYDNFLDELNKFCNNDFYKRWIFQKNHYKLGNICCIQYKSGWNRAKFLEITDGMAKLYLIDEGIIINVYTKDIRYLPKKFSILPVQAFRGSLEGIQPINERWNQESTNNFTTMTLTANIIKANIKFVKEDISYILAFGLKKNSDEQFFNELFVNKKLAKRSENDHFENKFPTFNMIENSEYPSWFDIRNMSNNGISYISNELILLKEFEQLNSDDLRVLYLHFKNNLTNQKIDGIKNNCFVIEKMRKRTEIAKDKCVDTADEEHKTHEKISEWVAEFHKKHGF